MKRVLLLLGLIAAAGLHAQEPGLLEVRVGAAPAGRVPDGVGR